VTTSDGVGSRRLITSIRGLLGPPQYILLPRKIGNIKKHKNHTNLSKDMVARLI